MCLQSRDISGHWRDQSIVRACPQIYIVSSSSVSERCAFYCPGGQRHQFSYVPCDGVGTTGRLTFGAAFAEVTVVIILR
jgi:hypothetical protein